MPKVKVQRRRLLVVGNSRSGTTYFARVLKEVGIDVGHEYVRKDGTVSCFFFIDTPTYPISPSTPPKGLIAHVGERKRDYEFDRVLHIVRDPLKTIGSICKTMGTQHQLWLEKHKIIPKGLKPKFLKAMHTWYEVNRRCELIADYRFKLEDIKEEWSMLCDQLDLVQSELPKTPKSARNESRGIFKAKIISWQDMLEIDPVMCKKIGLMAMNYGYKVQKRYWS